MKPDPKKPSQSPPAFFVQPIFFLACLVHCLFIVSWLTGWLDFLFVEAIRGHGQAADFYGIYQAGENLLRGYSIYDSHGYINEAPQVVPFYYFYRYLPPTAYAAAIGALLLKPWPAYWVWLVVNELMIGAFLWTLFKNKTWNSGRRYLAAALCLGFCPIYIEQFMGQYSLTMALLLWLLWRLDATGPGSSTSSSNQTAPLSSTSDQTPRSQLTDNRSPIQNLFQDTIADCGKIIAYWRRYSWRNDRISSLSLPIVWALSITLKSFSVFLTWPFLLDRQLKRTLLTAAISIAVCVPYFVFYPADILEFLRLNLSPFSPQIYMGAYGLQNSMRDLCVHLPTGFTSISFLFAGREIFLTRLIMLSISLLILVLAIWASIRYHAQRNRQALNLLLWVTVFFLVFKSVWEYHYIMMLPGIIAVYLSRGSRFVLAMGFWLGLPTLYFLAPILFDVTALDGLNSWPAWFRIIHFSVKTLPTVALFLWCLGATRASDTVSP